MKNHWLLVMSVGTLALVTLSLIIIPRQDEVLPDVSTDKTKIVKIPVVKTPRKEVAQLSAEPLDVLPIKAVKASSVDTGVDEQEVNSTDASIAEVIQAQGPDWSAVEKDLTSLNSERVYAAYAFIQADADNYPLEKTLPYLVEGVADKSIEVAQMAIQAAERYVDDPRITPAIQAALQSQESEVRGRALDVAFNMEWTPAVKTMIRGALKDADSSIQEHALSILNFHGNGVNFDSVEEALKSSE